LAAPTLDTDCGRIRGAEEDGVQVFRGVPFARAPAGELRFRPPEPPTPWRGDRDATRFGPAPPQRSDPVVEMLGLAAPGATSEDCLHLNAWTPATRSGRRPVLVWIHGGGFASGTGGVPLYDGRRLATRGDAVVVTLNYRVGALGFLHLEGLDAFAGAANLGLRDQIAALRFVRAHAERLGGDPSRVTVFGESAGAGSIVALLAVPEARGLFQRAIVQSAAPTGMISAEAAAERTARFLGVLGLSPARAGRLRELPVETLLDAQQRLAVSGPWKMDMPFVPVVDGALLPEWPVEAVARGAARDVDLVVGTTTCEMQLFGLVDEPAALTRSEVLRRLVLELPGPGDAARVLEAFRAIRPGASEAELLYAIQSEVRLRYHSIRLAEAQALHRSRSYMYRFTWRSPFDGGKLGSCHALDLPFTFGTLDSPGMAAFAGSGPVVERIAGDWMDAWLAFARSGDPSHARIGAWPAYSAARRATMALGERCGVELAPLEAERAALDGVDWKALP